MGGQIAHTVGQVGLHLAAPFAIARQHEVGAVADRAAEVGLQHRIAGSRQALHLAVEIGVVATAGPAVRHDDQRQALGVTVRRQAEIGADAQSVGGLVGDNVLVRQPVDRNIGIVLGQEGRLAGREVDEIVAAGVGLRFSVDDDLARIVGEAVDIGVVACLEDLGEGVFDLFEVRIEVGVFDPVLVQPEAGQAIGRRMEER